MTGSLAVSINPLERVMVIARRDGGLVLHGLMALDEKTPRGVEALGEIAHPVVPSAYHRLDAARYRARYPRAKLFAPAGARSRVEQRSKVDATFDGYDADAREARDPRIARRLRHVLEHEARRTRRASARCSRRSRTTPRCAA